MTGEETDNMSEKAVLVAQMVNMLPPSDQGLAFELVKKLVLAWDPDFTKLTPEEAVRVKKAEKEIESGDYVPFEEIPAIDDK